MFKEIKEGQTHYKGDKCGEPAHNCICQYESSHSSECPFYGDGEENKLFSEDEK